MRQSGIGIQELLAHADWLRRLATHLVHDRDAEDLTQDTWSAALQSPPGGGRPAEPWLATVLRNVARRRWREERLHERARPDLEATATPVASPQELLERAQVQRALAEAVVELEEPYRSAVLLRYYEGRTAADIARELGVPAGTVRWRLSEGIERLRRRLDDQHEGDRKAWKVLLAPLGSGSSSRSAPQPAAPVLAQGGWLMALGTKGKLGVAVAVLALIAAGFMGGRLVQSPSVPGGRQVAGDRALARTGIPTLMPSGSVSDQSGTIEGVVRDPDGRPLAGAVVVLTTGPSGNTVFGPGRPAVTALTDGQGSFRLAGIAAGEHRVSATAVGFAPSLSAPFLLAAQEGRRLDLTVTAGGHTLEGQILDDGGGSVPGARVTAWAGSTGSMGPSGAATIYQVVADAEGRYRIALSAREYTVRAEAGGYAPTETTIPVTRDLRKDLRLYPAARISGQVLERGSRKPVADAQVTLTPASRMVRVGQRVVRADAEGRFQIDDAESGMYQVLARLGGAQAVGPEIAVVPTQAVQGIEVLLDVHQKAAVVEGRVVDPAGNGLAGARVVGPESVISGADGVFRLPGVMPGPVRLRVTGRTPDLGEAEHTAMVGPDGARDVRIVLAPRPVIGGRVIDAAGLPVPGAQVRGDPQGPDMRSIVVETAADGTFRLAGLLEGRAWLMAWHPTLGVVRQDFGPLMAGRNDQVELRLAPGASIAGTVRYEDGKPAGAVSVAFTGQERGGLYTSVSTADDGSYRSGGLPPGKYTVRTRRKGGPWNVSTSIERPDLRLVMVAEGQQKSGVDLVLKAGGQTIAGKVVLPDGTPAIGTTLVASNEEDGKRAFRPTGIWIDHSAVAGEDGSFTLDDLESGSFTVWAARPGMPDVSVDHVAGGRRDLRITLRPGASLSGVVVDRRGQPVPRFSLNVLAAANNTADERRARDGAAMSQRPVNDPGGAFEWGGLTPGSYEVQARTADGAGGKQIVTVGEGERKQGVRVVVETGAIITGTAVSLETGAPLSGLRMYARLAGRHADATTDAKGGFEITGLMPGEEAEIRVMSGEDLVPEHKRVVVPAGVARVDAGTFRLMKRDPKQPPRFDGTIRMVVENQGEKVAVSIIRPGSPAERAGIKLGDTVLSVEGRDVRGLGPGAINYLMGRDPGQTVTLVVQTPGGEPRTVTATAEAMGSPPTTTAANAQATAPTSPAK